MSNIKIYYKIVSPDLKSVIMNPSRQSRYNDNSVNRSKFCIQYKINEWVKPKAYGTKLMVFDSLLSAQCFRREQYLSAACIYKCQVKNPSKNGFIVQFHEIENYYTQLSKAIKNKKKRPTFNTLQKIPYGTVFCSAVKLLERMEKNENNFK